MKRFIILASLITLLLAVLVFAAGYLMAATGPFHPGDPFFQLQSYSEQVRARLTNSTTSQASYRLDLIERRINDLEILAGGPNEILALQLLDKALDDGLFAVSSASPADIALLHDRLSGSADCHADQDGYIECDPERQQ